MDSKESHLTNKGTDMDMNVYLDTEALICTVFCLE